MGVVVRGKLISSFRTCNMASLPRTWFLCFLLRWLKTVSNTFQDVDFDRSLLPLFISWCYNHGIKKLPNHWWTRWYCFCDIIGYHTQPPYPAPPQPPRLRGPCSAKPAGRSDGRRVYSNDFKSAMNCWSWKNVWNIIWNSCWIWFLPCEYKNESTVSLC